VPIQPNRVLPGTTFATAMKTTPNVELSYYWPTENNLNFPDIIASFSQAAFALPPLAGLGLISPSHLQGLAPLATVGRPYGTAAIQRQRNSAA